MPAFGSRALYEDVAEHLRQRIFSRALEPGSWIDEQKLAAEWGISRTPLREALKVLAVEGLVTMKLRRGAYVTEMSARDVSDVYHLLGLLESDAAAAVAANATAEQLRELAALHAQLEAASGDRERFFALNESFHLRLLEMADNRWRLQIVADLRKMMKLNRHHSLFREGRLAESLKEHRALLRALQRRDAGTAASLMKAHFDHGLAAASPAPTRAAPDAPPGQAARQAASTAPKTSASKAATARKNGAATPAPARRDARPKSASKDAGKKTRGAMPAPNTGVGVGRAPPKQSLRRAA
jgi:DNA-binding GntR family transcriptional regulator